MDNLQNVLESVNCHFCLHIYQKLVFFFIIFFLPLPEENSLSFYYILQQKELEKELYNS